MGKAKTAKAAPEPDKGKPCCGCCGCACHAAQYVPYPVYPTYPYPVWVTPEVYKLPSIPPGYVYCGTSTTSSGTSNVSITANWDMSK